MKTGNWVVVLMYPQRAICGDSLDRLTRMADELLADGKIPSPIGIASAHSSATAADRAAAKLTEKLKDGGWWHCDNSARTEEWNQEGEEGES